MVADPISPSGEIVPLLLGAWALAEIGLTTYDVYSTSETLLDKDATFGEKFRSTSFTVAGLALPGGGYGKADDAGRGFRNIQNVSRSSGWNNPVTLAGHTISHARDFGLKSTGYAGYAKAANSFYKNTKTTERFTDSKGVTRVYDKKTNTFGSYTKDGKTKTFFKPDRGVNYWKDQKKKYGKK
jgi:hypothetical protein